MTATILPMPGFAAPTQAITDFLRIGHSGHRKLEELHAQNMLAAGQFVFDASSLSNKKELLAALRGTAAEIVLDTNTEKLSFVSQLDKSVSKLPWGQLC